MLSNVRIATRLALGFGSISILLVVLWGINYLTSSRTEKEVGTLFHGTVKSMELALRVRALAVELRRDEKDVFLNLGTPAADKYLGTWNANREKLVASLGELEKNADHSQDQAISQSMKSALDGYASGFLQVAARIRGGDVKSPQEANELVKPFKDATHRLMEHADILAADLVKRSATDLDSLERDNQQIKGAVALITFLTVVFGIALALVIRRSITAPINRLQNVISEIGQAGDLTLRAAVAGKSEIDDIASYLNHTLQVMEGSLQAVIGNSVQVAEHADSLAGATTQLEQSSRYQAESTGKMASATEEMSASLQDVAERAAEAEKNARNVADLVAKGTLVVGEAATEMGRTAEMVADTAVQISDLSDKSAQISGIVGVIKEIADQTNLLALNAAIEAARAGEQGRGFAVVADEVRKLAERTALSTTEISGLIGTIRGVTDAAATSMEASRNQADKGARLAQEAGSVFARINEGTAQTLANMHDIAASTQEEKSAMEHVASNVETVAQLAEENSAATSQVFASARHLKELADHLLSAAKRFKVAENAHFAGRGNHDVELW